MTILEVGQPLYTVEEFLELDLPDDDTLLFYELIEGEIVARPKSGISGKHGDITAVIAGELYLFLKVNAAQKKLGRVYSGASTLLGQPEGSNYLVPDVCFVTNGRTPDNFSGPIPVAPDLVVEVNSPSDSVQRIHQKIQAYLAAGVRLVWSVYMLEQFVIIYRASDPTDPSLVTIKGELDGEEVLSGFRFKVSALFE